MAEPTSEQQLAPGVRRARDIPVVSPDQAIVLEAAELERFLALLESLAPDDWSLPIPGAPRHWDVKALVAQVIGQYAAQASLRHLRRLASPRALRFYHIRGRSLLETVRQAQVGDRMFRAPDELLAELRETGPRALRNRAVAFRPLAYFTQPGGRLLRPPDLPLGPLAAVRDLWFHRATICAVAERPFAVASGHDDRIVEALVQLAAGAAERALPDAAVDLAVAGLPALRLRFGAGDEVAAAIAIAPDPLVQLLARRRSAAWAREHATVEGSSRLATVLFACIADRCAHRPY